MTIYYFVIVKMFYLEHLLENLKHFHSTAAVILFFFRPKVELVTFIHQS